MKTLSKIDLPLLLQRIAIVIFVFFITLAAIAQIFLITRTWSLLKAFQIGLLVGVFLIPVGLIFTSPLFWGLVGNLKQYALLWVIAIALGLRVVLIPLISTDFVTDMEDIHLFAADVYAGDPFANLKNYPNIPQATYLTLTGYVLSFVYKLFGASTGVAKFFLVVLAVLTVLLMYLVGRELGDVRTGLFASFLYAALPSLICYTGVLTGDHLALPLMMSVILVQTRLYTTGQARSFYILIGYAICGALIGLTDWFRPVGLILLIAVVVSMLVYQLRKQTFLWTALALGILVLSYLTVSKLAVVITEKIFQTRIASSTEKIGAYVYVGLNSESGGGVTLDDARTIGETYQRFGRDYAAANRYLIDAAFGRLEKGQLGKLLIEKFNLMWASHNALFDYALIGSNDQDFVNLLRDVESLPYLVITVFILVNAISSMRRKSPPGIFAMQLFVLGFALLMLLFEVQNRYVIVVIPYSILLAVLGMRNMFPLRQQLS